MAARNPTASKRAYTAPHLCMGGLVASRALEMRESQSSVKRSTFLLLSRRTQGEAWKPAGEQRKARTAGAYRSLKAKLRTPPGNRSKRVKHLPMTARRQERLAAGACDAQCCSRERAAHLELPSALPTRPFSRLGSGMKGETSQSIGFGEFVEIGDTRNW